jgi:alanine racemase
VSKLPKSQFSSYKVSVRPTWAEVSLGALRRNFRLVQSHVGAGVTVCAVVKADAYGHGAIECARALEEEGARWFGVTSTEEGLALREAGIRGRILLMTGFWRGEEEEVIRHRLTPAVWQSESLESLEDAAKRLKPSEPLPVHVKVDTGMSRLGLAPGEVAAFVEKLRAAPHVKVESVFTHLASAEITDARSNAEQLAQFDRALAEFRRHGISPELAHTANSAAIASRPASWHNFVRPGISLYGYFLPFVSSTGSKTEQQALPVEPVLSWRTTIVGLRQAGAKQGVGYNATYVTRAPMRLAVLPVGYADGFNRLLSCRGRVLVRGQEALVVGNISMDLTLVDVTAIPEAAVGDEVVIFGESGSHKITASEHANLAGTIPYEILCAISKRVPRRYLP